MPPPYRRDVARSIRSDGSARTRYLYEFNNTAAVVLDFAVDDDVIARQVPGLFDGEDGVDGASTQYQELVDDSPAQVERH